MCEQRAMTGMSQPGARLSRACALAWLAWISVALSAPTASAQSPAEFFRGKTVSLLIGFGPGGEDDLWARLVARHMTTHMPGHPNIVPVHMPGSGGLLVANRLYNTAAKDGTTLGLINRGIAFEPLLGGQGTQFEALMRSMRAPSFAGSATIS